MVAAISAIQGCGPREGVNSVAHGTGRNSGVVHSGIYYAEGSLRAKLCVSGARQMLEYVEERQLWNDRCGKLLVPPTESSLSSMDVLLNRGRANGVEIHKVTGQEALELEPRVNTKFGQALYVPITSVVNPKEVAERVREEVVSGVGSFITVRPPRQLTPAAERRGHRWDRSRPGQWSMRLDYSLTRLQSALVEDPI